MSAALSQPWTAYLLPCTPIALCLGSTRYVHAVSLLRGFQLFFPVQSGKLPSPCLLEAGCIHP